MTRKLIMVLFVSACAFTGAHAQKAAIKTNVLHGGTTTPNLAIEFGMGPRTTLDIAGGYNPFVFDANKKLKHFLIQPEVRHWFCDRFAGTFMGIHLHGGEFNVGGIGPLKTIKNNRYEGYLYGAGIGIGHQWILSNRWGLEIELGLGYARLEYDMYGCDKCAPKIESGHYNYFGPTRLALSLVYHLW